MNNRDQLFNYPIFTHFFFKSNNKIQRKYVYTIINANIVVLITYLLLKIISKISTYY